MLRKSLAVVSLGATVAVLGSACEVSDVSSSPGPATNEAVGTSQEPIHEAACATIALSDPNGGSIALTGQYQSVSPSSANYGAGRSTCPHQYVVEFTNWDQSPSNYNEVVATFASMPTNATDCANSRIYYTWYGYNGSWTSWMNSDYYAGSWSGGACSWVEVTGYPITNGYPAGEPSQSYSKARLAVQAFRWSGSTALYQIPLVWGVFNP